MSLKMDSPMIGIIAFVVVLFSLIIGYFVYRYMKKKTTTTTTTTTTTSGILPAPTAVKITTTTDNTALIVTWTVNALATNISTVVGYQVTLSNGYMVNATTSTSRSVTIALPVNGTYTAKVVSYNGNGGFSTGTTSPSLKVTNAAT